MRLNLEIVFGPFAGRTLTTDQPGAWVIGRAADAGFCVGPVTSVSRYHCAVEFRPPDIAVTDLLSTCGTLVNGRPAKRARLSNGDMITLGETCLRVRLDDGDESYVTDGPHGDGLASHAPPGFALVKRIGAGAMGQVFQAFDLATGEPRAVKMHSPAAASENVSLKPFLREATMLQRLDHRRVVRFHAMGLHGSRLFFAMEYFPTIVFSELLKSLPDQERVRAAVGMMLHVLEGLAYLHSKGMVHRDVKPGNILVRRTGHQLQAKITDFGLAKMVADIGLNDLTWDGEIRGTLAFMPPEQATSSRRVTAAADVFAAAATLHAWIACRMPRGESKNPAEMIRTLATPIEPLIQRCGFVEQGLSDAVARGLAIAPEERPTALELWQMIRPFAS